MNNLTKFRLLDIYESEECQGVISPYMIKDSLFNIANMLFERHENLYKVFESIPNTKFAHGSASCISTHPSTQQPNNINTENYSQTENSCSVLGKYSKILPPHKVSYTCADKPIFESNIYQPCITPLEQSKSNSSGVYNTGGYPGDVNNYPSMDQISTGQGSCDCSCPDLPNYTELSENRDILQHELFLWLRSIRDIQITNLISSLVEAAKIPIDAEFMFWMRRTLRILLDTDLCKYIKKMGVIVYTQRTISAPHIKRQRQLFIQVDTSDDTRDRIAAELTEQLTSTPKHLSVMVLTPKEYDFYRQHYPIDVCFDCAMGHVPNANISTMEMVLVNDNQFIPKIYMEFKTNDIVKVMAPADCMHISAGTSGKIAFRIGETDPNTWSVDKVVVNNHRYSLEELLDAHLPDVTGHSGIREYEYTSLSAEYVEIGALPYNYSELALFYTNITSNVTISIETLRILTEHEFNIDLEHIQYGISKIIDMNLSFFYPNTRSTQSTLVNGTIYMENEIIDGNEEDDNSSTDDPKPQKERVSISLTIPFIGICKEPRNMDLLKLRQIIRDPNTLEVIDKLNCPDVLISLSGKQPSNEITSLQKSQLTYNKRLILTNCQCDESSEFELTIGQGALWVHSAKRQNSYCAERATNQDIILRFAFDSNTKELEVLSDDALPGYLIDSGNTEEESLKLEIVNVPNKLYFLEGKTVTKEELIELGLDVYATGGTLSDAQVRVTDDIAVSDRPLKQKSVEDKTDVIDIYYTSEQGEQATTQLTVFVYTEDDSDAMYASCTAYYTFDETDQDNIFKDSITNRKADIVPYSDEENRLTGTIESIDDGATGRPAISFGHIYGDGLKMDAPIGTGDFTVSMYVRCYTVHLRDVRVFSIKSKYNDIELGCCIDNNNLISLNYNVNADNAPYRVELIQEPLPKYKWILITLTVKDGVITVYNNGEAIQNDSEYNEIQSVLETFSESTPMLLIAGDGFVGDIDEVMIFDTALTADQIKTLFK